MAMSPRPPCKTPPRKRVVVTRKNRINPGTRMQTSASGLRGRRSLSTASRFAFEIPVEYVQRLRVRVQSCCSACIGRSSCLG